MKIRIPFFYILFALVTIFCSCGTQAPRLDYQALAKASHILKLDIDLKDNHNLYLEAAQWIGTPYRSGGCSKQGTDCSGMVYQIYKKVYHRTIPRNSEELKKKSSAISKRNLQEGDLVFFTNNRSRKKVGHVGIYLKNGQFIHASSSHGVVVSNLKEDYYQRHWIRGGRIK